MAKPFFDVFPTIQVKGDLRSLFSSTQVTRVAFNRDHTRLKVYLESDHLIHKTYIFRMEEAIAKTVFAGAPTQVLICEQFSLSAQYNPQMLMEEYRDSLTTELWHISPILGSFYKDAEIEYSGEEHVILRLEDSIICREVGNKLAGLLDQIFHERCGIPAYFELQYSLPVRSRAKAEIDDYVPVIADADDARQAIGDGQDGIGAGAGAESTQDNGNMAAGAAAASSGKGNSPATQSAAAANKPQAARTASKGGAPEKSKKRTAADNKFLHGFIRSNNPDVIVGKEFEGDTIPIADILGEMGEVTIRGKIISSERRDIRNEKSILKFVLTDFTDSIAVKIFAPTELADQTMQRLAGGKFVKVRGFTKLDTFEHEVAITSPFGIMSIPSFVTKRQDHYAQKRVELHLHTKMSDMDGLAECSDLVKRAYEWGMPAVAITDHGNVHAFPDANHVVEALYKNDSKKRKENGEAPLSRQEFFKVIYGVECYLVDDLKKMVTFGTDVNADYRTETGSYVVFDIETTGFSSDKDKIIEIGAVRYDHGKETGRFSEFINPERPIPFRITQLTSITDDMVMKCENVEKVLPRFLDFCKDAVLVGHNVGFDISFIKENARRLELPCPFTTIDTIGMARVMLPGHNSYRLDAVAKLLNVSLEHHHRAVDDAGCTAEIFVKLLNRFTDAGAKTLGEMNRMGDENKDTIRRLRPYHCVLLAQNNTGRDNLYKMVSSSHLDYFHQKPKIPKSMLMKYREGILVGSACVAGELYQALLDQRSEEMITEIVRFYDYLEIQPRDNNRFLIASEKNENITCEEDILNINRRIVELGDKFGKPVVATGDVHFLDPEDEVYRTIIQGAQGMADEEPAPLYFKTTDEMMDEFSYLGSRKCEEVVITNTQKIAAMVDAISPVRPDKCPPVIENSDGELREICYNKAHRMYGDPLPPVVEARLERELNSIISNGYAVMYIIAQKLVWKSNEDGYLVGSRGSVGSSFVATMSGITEVNPLPPHYYCENEECHYSDFDSEEVQAYAQRCGIDMPEKICPRCGRPLKKDGFNIPFETFLGFKGDKEPDIDLNFSGEYQSKAHAYTKVIFGHEQTFKAGTIATVADKTAYGYVRGYCERSGQEKRKCEMERLAAGCTGVRRSTGQHPGGIVVLPQGEDINTFTPVQHPANDTTTDIITTHFDYHSIDHNLLKLDILGHDDPTMIRMLQDLTGMDPLTIPLDDKKVMSLFQSTQALGITPEQNGGIRVGTLGVPEFGTKFVMGMLEDTKPTMMSELVRISGLSHGTDVWLGNAQSLIQEGKAVLSTCICCRDDIMIYLIAQGMEASLSFKTMESVRKGKGLSPEMEEAMIAANVPDWYIASCKKIKYMFPRAHAAAYVMMALRIAYCKVYYPLAYYAAYFSIRAKSFDYEMMAQGQQHLLDMMAEYNARKDSLTPAEEAQLDDALVVREMYARGIEFLPIDITKAKSRAFSIVDGKLMPSFTSIHGMGASAADQLEEAVKKGPFVSKDDLRERAKISQTIVDKMSELGMLGDLPDSNQFSLFDFM